MESILRIYETNHVYVSTAQSILYKHNNPVGSGPTFTCSHNGGKDWGALSWLGELYFVTQSSFPFGKVVAQVDLQKSTMNTSKVEFRLKMQFEFLNQRPLGSLDNFWREKKLCKLTNLLLSFFDEVNTH